MIKLSRLFIVIVLFSFQGFASEFTPAIKPTDMEALMGIDLAKLIYLNQDCNVPVIVGKETLIELARVRAISEGFFSINSLSESRIKEHAIGLYKKLSSNDIEHQCDIFLDELGENARFVVESKSALEMFDNNKLMK